MTSPWPPPKLQQQIYQACDLEMIYRQHLDQVTINVTITSTTAQDLAAILGTDDGGDQAHGKDSLQLAI